MRGDRSSLLIGSVNVTEFVYRKVGLFDEMLSRCPSHDEAADPGGLGGKQITPVGRPIFAGQPIHVTSRGGTNSGTARKPW
jgi:hypothetical protein